MPQHESDQASATEQRGTGNPGPSRIREIPVYPGQRTTLSPEQLAAADARAKEADRKAAERQQAAGQKQRFARFQSQIGRRFHNVTLDNYVATHGESQRNAMARLRAYLADLDQELAEGHGIVLFGPPGTGKDHLLAAMAWRALAAGQSVEWRSGAELYSGLRERISQGLADTDLATELTRPAILILSDPGLPHGSLTNYQGTMLYQIIDARYRELRPTWATLNVATGQEADERVGAQVVDRLRDGAVCVYCDWPTYRKPK